MRLPAVRVPFDLALPLVLAAIVTASTFLHGVPALRHDWHVPGDPHAVAPWVASFFSPWLENGIGDPQPYPTFYLVGFALWPLAQFHSAFSVALALVGGGAFLAGRAATKIARQSGCSRAGAVAVAALATLNPWMYAKTIAGHIVMTLAYALLLALVAELTRPRPRKLPLLLLAAFTVTQIEFLVIACLPLTAWAVTRRRFDVLAMFAAAALPLAVGIFGEYGNIRGTPFFLPWQDGQSVPLPSGALLSGYEFAYEKPFAAVTLSLVALLGLALAGWSRAMRSPVERSVVAMGCACLLLASGTKGPLELPYAWAVVHIPEIGLFRELYDMIALVAIVEVLLLARALASCPVWLRPPAFRSLSIAAAVVAATLSIPWLVAPVGESAETVGALPRPKIRAAPGARVAFFPAFQPIRFSGKTSGTDPDAFVRDDGELPFNSYYPTFPLDAALGFLQYDGDTRWLSSLGVTQVIERPYFQTDWPTLAPQLIIGDDVPHHAVRTQILRATPRLAAQPGFPRVDATVADGSVGAVFFGDVPSELAGVLKVASGCNVSELRPDRTTIDPSRAWVDARLAFPTHPYWANPLGGVLTTGRLPLQVSGARTVLASAVGRIISGDGQALAVPGASLGWAKLHSPNDSLRCIGTCIVAAIAACVPADPAVSATAPVAEVHYEKRSPWLITWKLPAGAIATVRYAVRYDTHWITLIDWHLAPHLRLDGSVNGWIVPARASSRDAISVDWLAMLQWCAELAAAATLVVASASRLALMLRRSRRRS